jgi:hypothetical protein
VSIGIFEAAVEMFGSEAEAGSCRNIKVLEDVDVELWWKTEEGCTSYWRFCGNGDAGFFGHGLRGAVNSVCTGLGSYSESVTLQGNGDLPRFCTKCLGN